MKDPTKQAKIVLDSISAMVQSALNKAKFNTKKRATIQALNADGTANITMNGITYNNVKIRTGLLPQVNEVVWIEIPNNNFNDAFIDTANHVVTTGGTSDYSLPIATSTVLGGIKSGTDISIDTNGNVSINDDSHNHIISNVDGLQSALDGKSATGHAHTASGITDFDTEVSNNTTVSANTSARHTHSNKSVLDATTASFLIADETKLDGIEAQATKNSADATLLNRANHTGTQIASTISDFGAASRAVLLTGLSTATNVVITATDSFLSACGKLQKQITDNLSTLTTHISDAVKHITSAERTLWNTVSNKVDKVTGKGLSTEDYTTTEKDKLAGIADGANNYVHPTSHPPSIITQDTNNRFVTDIEKSTWNAKASNSVATTSINGLMSSIDKVKLDEIEVGTYGDIDGGSAISIYTLNQNVNGGGANG